MLMQETNLPTNSKIIRLRCEFIDLLDYLEKKDIEYVDINKFNEFIYIDPRNEFKYKISKVINNMETYTFQYHDNNNIPHAIFQPNILYDIDIDLENKTFKKLDEYKPIEPDHIIISMQEDIKKSKPMNIIRRLFGC
jgi:hypothetical protein